MSKFTWYISEEPGTTKVADKLRKNGVDFVEVRMYTVTIPMEQFKAADEWLRKEGLVKG